MGRWYLRGHSEAGRDATCTRADGECFLRIIANLNGTYWLIRKKNFNCYIKISGKEFDPLKPLCLGFILQCLVISIPTFLWGTALLPRGLCCLGQDASSPAWGMARRLVCAIKFTVTGSGMDMLPNQGQWESPLEPLLNLLKKATFPLLRYLKVSLELLAVTPRRRPVWEWSQHRAERRSRNRTSQDGFESLDPALPETTKDVRFFT